MGCRTGPTFSRMPLRQHRDLELSSRTTTTGPRQQSLLQDEICPFFAIENTDYGKRFQVVSVTIACLMPDQADKAYDIRQTLALVLFPVHQHYCKNIISSIAIFFSSHPHLYTSTSTTDITIAADCFVHFVARRLAVTTEAPHGLSKQP